MGRRRRRRDSCLFQIVVDHAIVVGELLDELAIPASTLSHHLDALRHEDLVEQEREGRFLRYRAGTAQLQALLNFLYAECCTRQPAVNISVPAKA